MTSSPAPYAVARPPEHSGVCWAAALGYSRRGQGQYDSDPVVIGRALDYLAEPTSCLCSRANRRAGRPRR